MSTNDETFTDSKETVQELIDRIGPEMCIRTDACIERRPHAPNDCPYMSPTAWSAHLPYNRELPPKLQAVRAAINALYAEPPEASVWNSFLGVIDAEIEARIFNVVVVGGDVETASDGLEHESCLKLAETLRALTLRERAFVFDMNWCPACEVFDSYEECVDCRGELVPIPELRDRKTDS